MVCFYFQYLCIFLVIESAKKLYRSFSSNVSQHVEGVNATCVTDPSDSTLNFDILAYFHIKGTCRCCT